MNILRSPLALAMLFRLFPSLLILCFDLYKIGLSKLNLRNQRCFRCRLLGLNIGIVGTTVDLFLVMGSS